MTTEYDKHMADWYVDKGLGTLIAQEKQLHPGMVVGTIAGGGHVATWPETDHAPEPDGSVDAGDFMVGPKFTKADGDVLVSALVEHRDDRIAYIIWQRRIISSHPVGNYAAWEWRPYNGTDPHTGHVHLSVNDKHENDNSAWNLGGKKMQYEELHGFGLPILTAGMDDADYDGYNGVVRAQALLNVQGHKLDLDGNYGPKMTAAVKAEFGGDGKRIDRTEWVKLAGLSRAV
jgi:hypothetical protein